MSAEKRKVILESTLELVKVHGFQGFPISEVAKKGGVAVGTIYHYFEGKDELIRELYFYVIDLIHQTASENDDSRKSFKERYDKLWSSLFNLYSEKPSILRFFELYNNSSYYNPDANIEDNKFYRWLFQLFEEGLASGVLRPISKELLSIIVLGNILTSAKVRINHSFRFKNKNIDLGQIAEIVWKGIEAVDNQK